MYIASPRIGLESDVHRESPLRRVKPNVVQSIRAHTAQELQQVARMLGHHFLYANLGNAQAKQDILESLAAQFGFPDCFGKNFDAMYDCLTEPLSKAGRQTGFVVVVEHIPTSAKFDKETREMLVDIFRDAADYWSDRKVPFRVFYSFAVARSAQLGGGAEEFNEPMPTDKLVDVSPMALRMSSPFNAGYWLAAK